MIRFLKKAVLMIATASAPPTCATPDPAYRRQPGLAGPPSEHRRCPDLRGLEPSSRRTSPPTTVSGKTLTSIDRIPTIGRDAHATLVIEHDPPASAGKRHRVR
ncbi:hypothetical protein FSB78_15645 [Sphingomonas ginsenosidivorax]|uniref:Uncharacterized protein n=1 Tax=Sphingomonas ginsenosidivorax TaxID=862135 RepID=A0A5C6UJ04_9SPHN|nr:hypothetical protein [Sphingomonas ginsenosidivorax]TXC72216.1 hypothetical protein FSB78_15645 [Sphingomonas ginsenosidivorax]